MNSRWMAASGCLVGRACARRNRLRRRRQQQRLDSSSGSGGGKTARRSTRRCRCRAPRASQTTALVNGAKLALEQAGGKAGDFTDQVHVARRLDGAGRHWTPEADSGERPQGGAGQDDRRLHRRVQLGRVRGLDPDPQRGRRPADLPGEHRRGPRPRTSRAPTRASRTSTTRPARAPTRASSRRTRSRAPRWPRS